MRQEPNILADKFRATHPMYGDTEFGASYGYFEIPTAHMHGNVLASETMKIISSGIGQHRGEWEHVSVSFPNRCPTWDEMCFVKNLFWEPEETVVQFHPAESKYVNVHEYCLHLWSRKGLVYELPPGNLVG